MASFSSRLPLGFAEAGFASQAEYDAAKAGPQTQLAGAAALAPGQASFGGLRLPPIEPVMEDRWSALNYPSKDAYETSMLEARQRLDAKGIDFDRVMQPSSTNPTLPPISRLPVAGPAVFGPGASAFPEKESQMAAQQLATAQATQLSRLPAGVMPVASPQSWMPGANRTLTQNAPGRSPLVKETPQADAVVAQADQRAAAASARTANIAAAKKLPDSDPNSFYSKRTAFNHANVDQHMDAEGNITKTTKAQKDHFTTLDAADATARAAQLKAEAVKAQAVSKLAADENKAEKERQKAAAEAAKNTPAAVSQRLTAIIAPPTPQPAQVKPSFKKSWLPILDAFKY